MWIWIWISTWCDARSCALRFSDLSNTYLPRRIKPTTMNTPIAVHSKHALMSNSSFSNLLNEKVLGYVFIALNFWKFE